MPVVSISLPEQLLERIDEAVRRFGYTGRSELIREAVREFLQTLSEGYEDKPVYALIVAVTDMRVSRQADQRVLEAIHEHQELVRAFHHQFLEEGLCLNIALVRATLNDLRYLLAEIRRTRGVRRAWFTILSEG
jgi:CopG family nickel-responsive transcriptional regulator